LEATVPSAEDCATLQAHLDGVDHVAKEAEAEWGVDRLPMLVEAELRAKFYRQREKWREAMETAWGSKMLTRDQLDAAASKSAAMQRAWRALEVAATEAGHRSIRANVWEARLKDGSVVAVVQTNAEASKVLADGRHVNVYTMAEFANVIDALPEAIGMAKTVFPGAKFVVPEAAGDRTWLRQGDAIPFGDS
jgi:hypothetical protein